MDKNMGEFRNRWEMPRLTAHHDAIVVRTSQTGKLSGRLYYPKPDWSGMEIFRFTVGLPASQDERPAIVQPGPGGALPAAAGPATPRRRLVSP